MSDLASKRDPIDGPYNLAKFRMNGFEFSSLGILFYLLLIPESLPESKSMICKDFSVSKQVS